MNGQLSNGGWLLDCEQGPGYRTTSELDVFAAPLEGISLIEASAGTGKTWNICALYLRLLLERGLRVQDILVVTFTNAAAAELTERIRARVAGLHEMLRDSGEETPLGDPFCADLVATVTHHAGIDRATMAARLDAALHAFDEAAIFTIHGFCQRALADAAFSAGLPFTLETLTDARDMTLEVVHDFWRRRIAGASCPPALAAYLGQSHDTPQRYAALAARNLGKPLARHVWPDGANATTAIETSEVEATYRTACAAWRAERDAIVACIRDAAGLYRNTYSPAAIAQAVMDWDDYCGEGLPLASLPKESKLQLFTRSGLQKRLKNGHACPNHPFFARADALLAARTAVMLALATARLALLRELIETSGPALQQAKRERRVIAFDDMLVNLHTALGSPDHHPDLAASLRRRFPAALIDEFQDTDPLQFAIFEHIYGGEDNAVFLVGDPKQAIYSFRNADLHAYLRARSRATREYTLAANQRSSAGLIAAINGLFGATRNAFMLPGLAYRAVTMGERERPRFVDASLPRADLQVWTLPTEDGAPVLKRIAKDYAARATAAEIARLLTAAKAGRITLGERALRPGDIAVLARTHREGSELTRALAALDIGSVELSQASVFQSVDAEEVERVLLAISQPSRESLLRAALATEMLGYDAASIAALGSDETRLRQYLERFAGYRELWLDHGVGVMYRRLLSEEKVSARLLCRSDGERRLTNLLHLGEEIHQAGETHSSPDALLRWLQSARGEAGVQEAAQLRLESDRNLVQIVTVHKAKGLEFPIVFCPFLWDGATRGGRKPEGCEYHDAEGNAVIDLRPTDVVNADPGIRNAIRLETAAEELRLIYVALTRAVHRCYVVAGCYANASSGRPSIAQSMRSHLNWLVSGRDTPPAEWLEAKRTPDEIAAAWQALAQRLSPHADVSPLPLTTGVPVVRDDPAPETLHALAPPRSIAPAWRVGSFTSLVSDTSGEAAASDHDARVSDVPAGPTAAIAPQDILRFPRGAAAGDCLHTMFERCDFTRPDTWPDAVAQGLREHPLVVPGVPAAERTPMLTAMARGMLADVLATPLQAGLLLRDVPRERRLTELEFSLPAPRISARALNAALTALGYDVPRLGFRDLEGYLKGFIDLVFEHAGRYYVLDWKSNHLGYAPGDYGPAALKQAMAGHSYHLQHLLYALALDRYLRHRLGGYVQAQHFGGVFYLFVRGVRPDWRNADGSPAGVFRHRPTAATLARLDALFTSVPSGAAP